MQTDQQPAETPDHMTVTDAHGGVRHKHRRCNWCGREFANWTEYNAHMKTSGCRWWRETFGREAR